MRIFFAILILTIGLFLAIVPEVQADRLEDLQRQINEYLGKITTAQSQQKTLSNELTITNSNIAITKLRITETEDKLERLRESIATASGRIDSLEFSLTRTAEILVKRIAKTYVAARADPVLYLFSVSDFAEFWQRFEYIRMAQRHDRALMLQMAEARKNYHDQKILFEDVKKQTEMFSARLRAQKAQLDRQNREKQALLEVTRNDEKRYQQLLAEAQRELDAIRTSQFTGKREVKRGEIIGYMGNTGFSFGAHLHFGVYSLNESQADSFNYTNGASNPLDLLRGRSLPMDSGACFDKRSGDNFGSGSGDWPMSSPTISQCYGKTPFSWIYNNGLHEGLDLYDNSDLAVRAVDDGAAYFYRGSSTFGNNARVFHGNGKMTLYLHLQ